jgi:hypothetical protein
MSSQEIQSLREIPNEEEELFRELLAPREAFYKRQLRYLDKLFLESRRKNEIDG